MLTAMASSLSLYIVLLLLLTSTSTIADPQAAPPLKILMASLDVNKNIIFSNWTGSDPCSQNWQGVSCTGSIVTALVLNSLPLGGFLPDNTLNLLQLRVLSLSHSQINGTLPSDLVKCSYLRGLYLEGNNLHGPLPSSLSRSLKKLYLSNNSFSGTIPASYGQLPRLVSLHLENNQLTGPTPAFNQITLSDFNISYNHLAGPIPSTSTLRKFSAQSFSGNSLLCGSPLPKNCSALQSIPAQVPQAGKSSRKSGKGLGTGVIVAIVLGDACVLAVIALICLCMYKNGHATNSDHQWSSKIMPSEGLSKEMDSGSTEEDKPKLVFFEGEQKFKLEDLLSSSAEFLGEGSIGPVYKATMENSKNVAVKRFKGVGQMQFGEEMEKVGRLRHQNVVPLQAYYHAKDEKLLVYEYQPNGSLFTLLHGNSRDFNPGQQPLSWNARLRIARGVANGLAYIHQEYATTPHGNIKASNILINDSFEACIADFGLATFINSSSFNVGYRAPELEHTRKMTEKGDVFSYGVLLLELLTGKMANNSSEGGARITLPKWVNSAVRQEWTTEVFDPKLASSRMSEEAMVSMLQVAISCVANSPQQRPKMSQVVTMIEDIKEEEYAAPAMNYPSRMNIEGSETPDSQFSFY